MGVLILYPEERKNYIDNLLNQNGRVSVNDLSTQLKVSEVTVRHDLAEMEKAGILTRTFGGAVLPGVLSQSVSYDIRKSQHIVEKKKVARRALQFIKDGMTIFLDAGTTTIELAPLLKRFNNLTLFTVDLNIALLLSQNSKITTYMVGGKVSTRTKSTESSSSIEQMHSLYFDLGILGCDAFNRKQFEINSEDKAEIKRAVIKNSNLTILLADGSKYGKHTTRSFATYSDIDFLITENLSQKDFNKDVRHKIILA